MANPLEDHLNNTGNAHPQYVRIDTLVHKGDIYVALGDGTLVPLSSIDKSGFVLWSTPPSPTGLSWLPWYDQLIQLMHDKGDLLTSDGHGNLVVIHAGAPGTYLTPDPTAEGGLVWTTLPVGTCPFALDFSFDCDSGYLAAI
jgi:hypothetical protein